MRKMTSVVSSVLFAGSLIMAASGASAQAASSSPAAVQGPLTGVWMTTNFPAVTETVGKSFTLDLAIQNKGEPPKRVALAVNGLPSGWTYEFDGGGKPVEAAMVGPDQTRDVTLKVTPADNAKPQAYPVTLEAKGDGTDITLPVKFTLAKPAPARLTINPDLPALRGTAKSSFDFQLTVKNDSPAEQVVNLAAQTPPGFDASFKQQYGSQQITSIPLKANASKVVKLSVKPPQDADAGKYKVAVLAAGADTKATTNLEMQVTGQPSLSLSGPNGRLSGDAVAGQEHSFNVAVKNTGGATADGVRLTASAPSGWKVDFTPSSFKTMAPGSSQTVEMHVTPANNAIAGDYMVNVASNASGASDSMQFRVTVNTATSWGIVGIVVIAAALLVMVGAVLRYGRR